MTHEFKKLIKVYLNAQKIGLKSVVATVVSLNGSSYRRPGVNMIITSNGNMTGAVSGGCVEKEILKQSASVFKSGIPKIMTYDGRYRLGCEGILYILIEPFNPSMEMINAFSESLEKRESFEIQNYFEKEESSNANWGSEIKFKNDINFPFNAKENKKESKTGLEVFTQKMKPCFELILIGGEHDAVQLTRFASMLGWNVTVAVSPSDPKKLSDFLGAKNIIYSTPETFNTDTINNETAIVLMTHSYVKDLKYLMALKDTNPVYLGLLGPSKRREKLLNEFIENAPDVNETIFDVMYGPSGLNIGAETPEEISLSICSEILAVIRNHEPQNLKDKTGTIHCSLTLSKQ